MKHPTPPSTVQSLADRTFAEIDAWMAAQPGAVSGPVDVPVSSFSGRAQSALLELLKPWGWRFAPRLGIMIEGPLRLIPIEEVS